MSDRTKGRLLTIDWKNKISSSNKDKKKSETHRKNLSKAMLHRFKDGMPESTKIAIGKRKKGHIVTEETRKKIGLKNSLRKRLPQEGFQKGHKNLLVHHTEEAKEKCRQAAIKQFKNPIQRELRRKNAIKQLQNPTFKNSSIEIKMQKELDKRNIVYEKHKPLIGKFAVDLFIQPNIVIECDGSYWHNRQDMKEKDAMRNIELKEKGYKVYRFWDHEINESPEKCINKIKI